MTVTVKAKWPSVLCRTPSKVRGYAPFIKLLSEETLNLFKKDAAERLRIKLLKGAHTDCRSCAHRSWWKLSWKNRAELNGWDCKAIKEGGWLAHGVFLPACGLKKYRTSFLKYLAYKLYCRFVFDDELVYKTLRRLDGHLD